MEVGKTFQQLKIFAEEIRVETLKTIASIGFGHIGGSMSVVEALAVLYGRVMRVDPSRPTWEDRDIMVMSKGHAGPAVYAALAVKGYYDKEETRTLNQPHTRFPSHTDRTKTPGVDFTTGSLGQGVSAATGMAYGNRLDEKDSRVYVFVGDGECDEGQVWEAAQFAAHYALDNLVFLIDNNGYQLDGAVDSVLRHGDIGAKFEAFGFFVQSVDGHDVEALTYAFDKAKATKGKPSCIVLNTIKGKGCIFTEGTGAHSSQPSKEQMSEAIEAAERVLLGLRNKEVSA